MPDVGLMLLTFSTLGTASVRLFALLPCFYCCSTIFRLMTGVSVCGRCLMTGVSVCGRCLMTGVSVCGRRLMTGVSVCGRRLMTGVSVCVCVVVVS